MNKVANTYWIDARLAAQNPTRMSASTLDFSSARTSSNRLDARTARLDARSAHAGKRTVSSTAVFTMVVLTMFALCFTVTMRTHAEAQGAAAHYETINLEVEALRDTNISLKQQVKRLHTDSRAIEEAARETLGMVRPNDIIVPVR